MLALVQIELPLIDRYQPRIERTAQKVMYVLTPYIAVRIARNIGEGLQEAPNIRSSVETTSGKALQSLSYDGRGWLVANQHLAMACDQFEAIAQHGREEVIAIQGTRLHARYDLFHILLAMKLRVEGLNPFKILALGILSEEHVWAFKLCAHRLNCVPQIHMSADVARKPRDVINDDHEIFTAPL
ncbi:MAG: hypothetical protein RIE84_11355 [Parvibaculum sp.]